MQVQEEEKEEKRGKASKQKWNWYMIKFAPAMRPEEAKAVRIGLNGQRWEFIRNKPYAIPDPVLEVIRHTEHMIPVYDFSGKNQTEVTVTQELRTRFGFELREISEEEARLYWKETWGRALPEVKENT